MTFRTCLNSSFLQEAVLKWAGCRPEIDATHQRSERILPTETSDLTETLTDYLHEEGLNIITRNNFLRIYKQDGYIAVDSKVRGEFKTFMAEKLIVAMGRTPNCLHGT